jgi:hypothetical protein
MKLSSIVIAAIMLGACAQIPIVVAPPQSDYDRTLYRARQNVDAGNYWAADRLLEEFARTHSGTKEAREIAFWKAAYMVDPANSLGSLAAGIAALDGYLAATDSSSWYRNEATVLRRTAAAAQGPSVSLTASTAPASTTTTTDTVVVVSKSRQDEIASLKDQLAKSKEELAKVSAELERIKKRLANPSN